MVTIWCARWCCCYSNQTLKLLLLPYTVQECLAHASISRRVSSTCQFHKLTRCSSINGTIYNYIGETGLYHLFNEIDRSSTFWRFVWITNHPLSRSFTRWQLTLWRVLYIKAIKSKRAGEKSWRGDQHKEMKKRLESWFVRQTVKVHIAG